MTLSLPPLSLVLGGAASGKSDYGERLVSATNRTRLYIATAQAYDDEMVEKILRHQSHRGDNWRTIEAPLDAVDALARASDNEVVLFDCATMWLSNHIFADVDLVQAQTKLIDALTDCAAPVVIVSNEVGAGIVPQNALSRRFRQAQGELNQQLAAHANLVIAVMAGLPLILKGERPTGTPC